MKTIESEIREAVAARINARASYKLSLVAGEARWSGADLKGKARSYAARYAQARREVLALFVEEAEKRGYTARLGRSGNGNSVIVLHIEPKEA